MVLFWNTGHLPFDDFCRTIVVKETCRICIFNFDWCCGHYGNVVRADRKVVGAVVLQPKFSFAIDASGG